MSPIATKLFGRVSERMTMTADTTHYLHYEVCIEESSPEFTMKCTVGGEALGAAAVLERFAHAYSKHPNRTRQKK